MTTDPRAGRSQDDRWVAVDAVIEASLIGSDTPLEQALARSDEGGLPPIHVAPPQGKFLYLLAKAVAAERILEIGTLAGYSTIWLARALPQDGRLITLEVNPAHADVATANIEAAGLAGVVQVRVGPAVDSLATLKEVATDPFDLVFIDADKPSTSIYFSEAIAMSRPGSVIIVDNVVRDGGLADRSSDDPNVAAMQIFMDELSADERVEATALQTVGSKGYDGFVMALVR